MSTTELSSIIDNLQIVEIFSIAAKTLFCCFDKIADFVAVANLHKEYG